MYTQHHLIAKLQTNPTQLCREPNCRLLLLALTNITYLLLFSPKDRHPFNGLLSRKTSVSWHQKG